MKRTRMALAGIAALVLIMGAVAWWLPANWVAPYVQSRLHGVQLRAISGTLWQGRAGQVLTADGVAQGTVSWVLSRRALLGDVDLDVDLQQPSFRLQGHLHRLSATQDAWRDVSLSVDPAALGLQRWLQAQPLGQVHAQIAHAVLQGDWPIQIDGVLHWPAAVRTTRGVANLGGLTVRIAGDAGVIQANLSDDGDGALRAQGQLSLSPLGWDVHLTLQPRRPDPVLAQWLRTIGRPEADGTVRLSYGGGLAHLNSPAGA